MNHFGQHNRKRHFLVHYYDSVITMNIRKGYKKSTSMGLC